MDSHDINSLREAVTQCTADGRHPSFYRLCESYGRWVRSGLNEPRLSSPVMAGKAALSNSKPQISDKVGLFLDGLLCDLKAQDDISYRIFELKFMTRNVPALVRAKNARLLREIRKQGQRPSHELMDKLQDKSLENFRMLVMSKLENKSDKYCRPSKGRVWNSSRNTV